MIWLQPMAFVGLLALGLPVLIHLLGRNRAHSARFPSLRFVTASRLLPSRRTRLHDPLLLLVRVAILVTAVLAIAQPSWPIAKARSTATDRVSHVILVDTSASMRRATVAGGLMIDLARARAKALSDSSATALIIETNSPRTMMVGATAWLQQQRTRGALTVLSDFQTGTIDSATVAHVPSTIALSLQRIVGGASNTSVTTSAWIGDREVVARSVQRDSMVTEVSWSTLPTARRLDAPLVILGRENEQRRLLAARSAADAVVPLAGRTGWDAAGGATVTTATATSPVAAIMTSEYRAASAEAIDTTTPHTGRLVEAVAALRESDALRSAARSATPNVERPALPGLIVLRDAAEQPLVTATEQRVGDVPQLHLIVRSDASVLMLATLIATARDVAAGLSSSTLSNPLSNSLDELESTCTPDATLARWQTFPRSDAKATNSVPASNERATSPRDALGRWLWAVVLLLLVVEALLRRQLQGRGAGAGDGGSLRDATNVRPVGSVDG